MLTVVSRNSPLTSTITPKQAFDVAIQRGLPGIGFVEHHPFGLYEIANLAQETGVKTALGMSIGDQHVWATSYNGLLALINGDLSHDDLIHRQKTQEYQYNDESDILGHLALLATRLSSTTEKVHTDALGLVDISVQDGDKEILEACSGVFFPSGQMFMPKFIIPDGETEDTLLAKETLKGMFKRYGKPLPRHIVDRVNYELQIISDKGYSSYFLVVADYINASKSKGILVGPGRGSSAGSVVAYCLGITELCPLEHNLFFERFLNPERPSAPDVDTDFPNFHRQEAADYLVCKYGKEYVAPIITNGTIKAKSAIRDSARALGYSPAIGNSLASMVPPPIFGREISLKDCFDSESKRFGDAKRIREEYESSQTSQNIINLGMQIEGCTRSWGQHACGMVMSSKPLKEVIPVIDGTSGFDYPTCEKLGVIKMDFLGLNNLDIIMNTLKGKCVNPYDIPLDDEDVYSSLARGETIGVFQLEGSGMRSLLRKMKPTCFKDIVAATALYRPGPMSMGSHTAYALRKNGLEPILYPHPELEEPLKDILGDTYGLFVFQEQILATAREIAGYSLGEADALRKAMGKKKQEVIDAEFPKFQAGARSKGYSDECIDALWNTLIPFANYGFVKAHAASYSVISYWTAFLKIHYRHEFMAALLTANSNSRERLGLYLTDVRDNGITILPPDVNESRNEFIGIPDMDAIRVGLGAIKSFGDIAIKSLLEERERHGEFSNILDLLIRVKLNRSGLINLIKAGCLDEFGFSRRSLVDNISSLQTLAKHDAFCIQAGLPRLDVPFIPKSDNEYSTRQLLEAEYNVVGHYLSGHPLDDEWGKVKGMKPTLIGELTQEGDDKKVRTLGGLVTSVSSRDWKGGSFVVLTLEDLTGRIELLGFDGAPQVITNVSVGDIIVAKVYIKYRESEVGGYLNEIFIPDKIAFSRIDVDATLSNQDSIDALYDIVQIGRNEGQITLNLFFKSGKTRDAVCIENLYLANSEISEIQELFGYEQVSIR